MSTVVAGTPFPRAAVARVRHPAAAGVALAGLGVAIGAWVWLILAAGERRSVLSPPGYRAHLDPVWLLGPLHGLLPSLSRDPQRLHADLLVALVVMTAGWLAAWAAADALPRRLVAAGVGGAQVLAVLGPPQPLTDVFNYMLYGRMAAHGLNPYRVLPVAAHADPAFHLANWHHLTSPYGPLFTLGTEVLAPLGLPAALWTWKVVVVASSLGVLALTWWLALRFGRSPQRAIVAVGLCPVVLAVGIGGFHNDAPVVLCLLGAVACLVRGREPDASWRWDASVGLLAAAAAGLKPSFAVAAPLLVLGAQRRPWAIAGGALGGAGVLGLVLGLYGGALPDLHDQASLVTPLSLPNLLGLAAGHEGADAAVRAAARDVLIAAVAIATALVAWRRALAVSAVAVVLLVVVLTVSWAMPWYLWWALPLLAVGHPRRFAPVAVVAALWLGANGLPQVPAIVHAFGYYPTRTATGRANHVQLLRLVR